MTNYFLPLQYDTFYHVYNRGNNGEKIFFNEENYRYFLRKFGIYLTPYIEVYAYCLLPNHFHFLIKTKRKDEMEEPFMQIQTGRKLLLDYTQIASEIFRRFFLSYAKSIKLQEGRTGSLFEKNFKRKEVSDDRHLLWVVNYIHRNPQTHGLVPDFSKYKHSSYTSLLSEDYTRLKRKETVALFGSKEEFIRFHQTNPVIRMEEHFMIE